MLFECRGCDSFLLSLRYQLFSDRRETIARADARSDSSLPLGSIGIDGMGELLLCILSSRSRFRERNCGISAERQLALPSMQALFNAPEFAAGSSEGRRLGQECVMSVMCLWCRCH